MNDDSCPSQPNLPPQALWPSVPDSLRSIPELRTDCASRYDWAYVYDEEEKVCYLLDPLEHNPYFLMR